MEQRKKKTNKKSRLKARDISAIILAAALVINCICVLLTIVPKQYALNVGDVAEKSIYAPYTVIDVGATELAKDTANGYVEDICFKKGDLIVKEGTALTLAQYSTLRELDMIDTGNTRIFKILGVVMLIISAYAIFGCYLYEQQKDTFENVKSITIIAVLITVVMLLSMLTTLIDIHFTPVLLACLLASMLINDKTAFTLNILLSLSVGLFSRGRGGLMGFDSFVMMLASLMGGTAAVFMLKNKTKRGHMIAAGLAGGIAMGLVILFTGLAAAVSFDAMLKAIINVVVSSLVCAFLAVGSLAVWEGIFDAATPARLNELSSANHPLLKKLMLEAPGTYHHSMMAASLAEAAAQRIGADHVLARVAAYYHDVGKLRRPQYFVENQSGENIHDTLSPQESASIIIAHQKDSVQLLAKYKLPGAIIKIASEHHGNSLMSYFYNKALSSAGSPAAINIKQYRYPANRPSTKESAIVMMADCCEAAVRSLGDTTAERVEQTVRNVISSKISGSDAQLANAPLTIAEVAEIEKAFIKTFSAIMHERIQYPDIKEDSKE